MLKCTHEKKVGIRKDVPNNPCNVSNMVISYICFLILLDIMIETFQVNTALWLLDGADDHREYYGIFLRHV